MIVSGGENIAGSEVERVLYEHEAVLEVAVVARPDERGARSPWRSWSYGPTPPSPPTPSSTTAGPARPVKVPRDITFLDALPRIPSGKVLKRELRAG
jgi:acyl-CoA synthetase (AMP-forming)/AMP-acid ligase II